METLRPPHRPLRQDMEKVQLQGGQRFSPHHTHPPRPEKGKAPGGAAGGTAERDRTGSCSCLVC